LPYNFLRSFHCSAINTILLAALTPSSAQPFDWKYLAEESGWWIPQLSRNVLNELDVNCGPPSELNSSGTPYIVNSVRQIDISILFVALLVPTTTKPNTTTKYMVAIDKKVVSCYHLEWILRRGALHKRFLRLTGWICKTCLQWSLARWMSQLIPGLDGIIKRWFNMAIPFQWDKRWQISQNCQRLAGMSVLSCGKPSLIVLSMDYVVCIVGSILAKSIQCNKLNVISWILERIDCCQCIDCADGIRKNWLLSVHWLCWWYQAMSIMSTFVGNSRIVLKVDCVESIEAIVDGFLASRPQSHFPGQYWMENWNQSVHPLNFWRRGLVTVPVGHSTKIAIVEDSQ